MKAGRWNLMALILAMKEASAEVVPDDVTRVHTTFKHPHHDGATAKVQRLQYLWAFIRQLCGRHLINTVYVSGLDEPQLPGRRALFRAVEPELRYYTQDACVASLNRLMAKAKHDATHQLDWRCYLWTQLSPAGGLIVGQPRSTLPVQPPSPSPLACGSEPTWRSLRPSPSACGPIPLRRP
jgi:hypothetical protein